MGISDCSIFSTERKNDERRADVRVTTAAVYWREMEEQRRDG